MKKTSPQSTGNWKREQGKYWDMNVTKLPLVGADVNGPHGIATYPTVTVPGSSPDSRD